MHLGQVASTLDLPIEVLRQLNPQYRLDIIPATGKHYTLVLPQEYACRYIACEEEIQRKDSLYLKEYINPVNVAKKRAATSSYLTHTVKRAKRSATSPANTAFRSRRSCATTVSATPTV